MKPRILAPLDPQKIMNQVAAQIVKEAKRGGLSLGEVSKTVYPDGTCLVDIENSGGHAALIEDSLSHPNIEVISIEHHDGHYIWDADHYVKDSDSVHFKLVR
jgi:hypothetical protein